VLSRARAGHRFLVTVLLTNELQAREEDLISSQFYVFQPQIRIAETAETRVVQGVEGTRSGSEEAGLAFVYRNRPALARGHLCSAVWREIDPEDHRRVNNEIDFPGCRSEPPFCWIDGEQLEQEVRVRFSPARVRTEYVPAYSIPSPRYDWTLDSGPAPLLDAAGLAEIWNPDEVRTALNPLTEGLSHWLDRLRSQANVLVGGEREIADRNILSCERMLARMRRGVSLLGSNEDARLAFCFANMALNVQSIWSRRTPLRWRPFQLAFLVLCIESLVDSGSPDRDICDLLWVPTGAGKTEAYLAVAAFVLAYRRRRSKAGGQPEEGVSVITRYTLRLLTIQQFRRTLLVTSACEYLRVLRNTDPAPVGWRPSHCPAQDNLLWGKTPFSLGLWVGGEVTPNRLEPYFVPNQQGGSLPLPNALGALRQQTGGPEPAQILNCPACRNILAISSMGLRPGTHSLHFVVRAEDMQRMEGQLPSLVRSFGSVSVDSPPTLTPHRAANYATLSLTIRSAGRIRSNDIDGLWEGIARLLNGVRIESFRASRPGYFPRWFVQQNNEHHEYDFDIFCTNPQCKLRTNWQGYLPMGMVHGRQASPSLDSMDGYRPIEVQEAFRDGEDYISDRIPILAYTVDDQVYMRAPSIVIATADKFARGPFEPRTSALFGNVTHHHVVYGFYRPFDDQGTGNQDSITGHRNPLGPASTRNFADVPRLSPPDLILQDELHLVEQTLGSLFGIYETAVSYLCQESSVKAKYIASTATVRRAEDQVRSVFSRGLQVFPPIGLDAGDRFFVTEAESHALEDATPGRLYLGICAPGRGPLTPLVRIWSRLMQTVWVNRAHSRVDPFWTLTGYFNAIRELGGARALYRQDIPQRMAFIDPRNTRPVTGARGEDRVQELSGRTPSTDLPSILELLEDSMPNAQDALFTTAMFGTGVDIQRIGLMIVNGQPKTTSSYIQSTGRIGRSQGGLVITLLRASKPRDLNHYEFFTGYHRQLHRFVEPVTVYPFAPGVLDRAAGPVAVFIMRDMRATRNDWHRDDSASYMATRRTSAPELSEITTLMENRAFDQPSARRPAAGTVSGHLSRDLDQWHYVARRRQGLRYVEYAIRRRPVHDVVLGDDQHQRAQRLGIEVVYQNAPQSLRDIEETTGFETGG
jgi:Helicase conserved C-terminal domain